MPVEWWWFHWPMDHNIWLVMMQCSCHSSCLTVTLYYCQLFVHLWQYLHLFFYFTFLSCNAMRSWIFCVYCEYRAYCCLCNLLVCLLYYYYYLCLYYYQYTYFTHTYCPYYWCRYYYYWTQKHCSSYYSSLLVYFFHYLLFICYYVNLLSLLKAIIIFTFADNVDQHSNVCVMFTNVDFDGL